MKETKFFFRVNELERRYLEDVGTPAQWCRFCVTLAALNRVLDGEGLRVGDAVATMKEYDFYRLFKEVFEEE